VEIWNRFVALENLDESLDNSSAWESIRDNVKISANDNLGYHRLKDNKPWFNDECSKLIDNGRRLIYDGCKIQAKSTKIICKI
jgi:hypothetical protein